LEKLGLNLGFLIVQIINFLVILVVLREWVYTPLQNSLKKRRETIEKGLEKTLNATRRVFWQKRKTTRLS